MDFHTASWQEIFLLISLGFVPSLAWLLYYLRKDLHPEPRMMIVKVFCWGFASTFVAFALEWVFIETIRGIATSCAGCGNVLPKFIGNINTLSTIGISLFVILAALAFIEELMKYTAAKAKIIGSRYFDEPTDAMIYLIVAALGFAAAENIGYVFQAYDTGNVLGVTFFRFASATFLHALSSGVVGYFLALSIIHKRHPLPYLAAGISFATLLHATFNFLIILSGENDRFVLAVILFMGVLFFIVTELFQAIHKMTFDTISTTH